MSETLARRLETGLFILILIMGILPRLLRPELAPPGMTHDEADHAQDSAGVLEGITPIYFSVGYGREPLFDYLTSLTMRVTGPYLIAGRVTAGIAGSLLLVLVYACVRRWTQNRWLALGAMAGLAFSFWGISASRQALRSILLPLTFTAAALAFRMGFNLEEDVEDDSPLTIVLPRAERERWVWFLLAGLLLGASFYTYLASRVMWLVFPAFFLFLSFTQRGVMRWIWGGLLVTLLTAGAVAAPLAYYLYTHPGAEARIDQLTGPLVALQAGDPGPLLANVRAGLGMFTRVGDDLWLYNIPGKPFLGPIIGLFFYVGISVALVSVLYPYRPARRGRQTADEAFRISSSNAFMLITLAAGIAPALVTGVGASSTRVIGMMPVLFYFPALGVVWLADWATGQVGRQGARAIGVAYAVVLLIAFGRDLHAYFTVWNNARDVRVAYHSTLVETLSTVEAHPEWDDDLFISSITPGRYHDAAVGRMYLKREGLTPRYFDGRSTLVLPADESGVWTFPEVAPLDPAFSEMLAISLTPLDQIELRPDDFNRVVRIVSIQTSGERLDPCGATYSIGGALHFEGCLIWLDGDQIAVITSWSILTLREEEVVLFTHIIDEGGSLIAQQDLLGYPSSSWVVGDRFYQLHRIDLPEGAGGTLTVRVGAYTLPGVVRLPVAMPDGSSADANFFAIGSITLP